MAYLAIAFSNMMATTCQYEALRYVSFPTQTLAKTAKMIPVMIWGSLLARRTYKLKDYIVAGGVTLGTTLFLLTGDVTSKQAKAGDRQTTLWGMIIMVAYLFFDGFTSTVQERLFKNREVSTWNQMLYVGLLSGLRASPLANTNRTRARTHTHTHTHLPDATCTYLSIYLSVYANEKCDVRWLATVLLPLRLRPLLLALA